MKLLRAIDLWTLAVFQHIVNRTQIPGIKYCLQIGILVMITAVLRLFEPNTLGNWVYATAFCALVLGISFWADAKYEIPDSFYKQPMIRFVYWTLLLLDVLSEIQSVAWFIINLSALSYFYFRLCEPPKPRKRKERKAKLAFNN